MIEKFEKWVKSIAADVVPGVEVDVYETEDLSLRPDVHMQLYFNSQICVWWPDIDISELYDEMVDSCRDDICPNVRGEARLVSYLEQLKAVADQMKEDVSDYEKIRERIECRLWPLKNIEHYVNAQGELHDEDTMRIYTAFGEDLAVVYSVEYLIPDMYCLFLESRITSIAVTRGMLDAYGITKKELLETAVQNMMYL